MTTETPPTSSKKLYTGSCHCGFVKYTMNVDINKSTPSRCNCTICVRKGTISVRAEKREDITLLAPASMDELTEYTFGQKMAHHYFCKTCGVPCFTFGSYGDVQFWAINGLTIDTDQGIDWSTIRLQYWDGRGWDGENGAENGGWSKGSRSEPYPHGSW